MLSKRLREVGDLKNYVGKQVLVNFRLKDISIREQAGGGESAKITMQDGKVVYDARMFNIKGSQKASIVKGKVYEALLKIEEYDKGKDGLGIITKSIVQLDIEPKAYIDWISNLGERAKEVEKLMQYISESEYGKIANKMILDEWGKYAKWVAGINQHHNSLGGLLMHHVCVGEICKNIAELYNELYKEEYEKIVNTELLVAVAIIHDIGKLKEISVNLENGDIEYSNESGLTTHITNGTLMIDRVGRELGVEEVKIQEMRHLMESHHGELEYGSPQKPHMLEAYILSQADMLDALSWKFKRVYDKVEIGESEKVWGGSGLELYYRNSGVIKKEN